MISIDNILVFFFSVAEKERMDFQWIYIFFKYFNTLEYSDWKRDNSDSERRTKCTGFNCAYPPPVF